MAARPKMDEELIKINEKVTQMGKTIEREIIRAVDSITKRDGALAREVIDFGDIVDDMEEEIQQSCFLFLATQAPVGSDLRYCISVMKMTRDLERIGDHCEDLAKYTLRLEGVEPVQEFVDIPRMAAMVSQMVNNGIEAFLGRNLRLARKVWKADEEVDELFRQIYTNQVDLAEKGSNPGLCVSLAFIAAHLERIGDYATNICEETVFFLEGEYEMDN